MKRRNFIYLGVIAVLAGSILSCGGSEADPNSYTDITAEEAQTIINNFKTEAALAEVNTLVVESTTVINTSEVSGVYNIDFSEDALYLHIDIDADAGSDLSNLSATTMLITGSGDSYTIFSKASSGGNSVVVSNECDYATAKENFDFVTGDMLSSLAFNDALLTEMESYGELTYGKYSDYIKFQVAVEEKEDEDNYYSLNSYAIYNSDGLLRYAYEEESKTTDGETTTVVTSMSVQYNATFTKITSLE